MKFGGALLGDAPGFIKVSQLVDEFSCEPLVVVVSALGKTTNALEELCSDKDDQSELQKSFFQIKKNHLALFNKIFPEGNSELSRELSNHFDELWQRVIRKYDNRYQAYDSIVSKGEELSSCMFSYYLISRGIENELVDAKKLIATDSNFTDASVDWEATEKRISKTLNPLLESKNVIVTQGFIASDKNGIPTTLGREGSDFSAAIIGSIIGVNEVTIWKNVPGLMNADPARFEDVIKLEKISYHEAIELAYYGASVIHPKTIQPLKEKNIPLLVRPFYESGLTPSVIGSDTSSDSKTPSIIVKDNQVLLSIGTQNLSFIGEENLGQIFASFSRNKIHVNLMQNSAVSFSVAFNEDQVKLDALMEELSKAFTLKYNTGLQLITIRHYDDDLINRYVGNRKIYLVQKSRATVQVLVEQ